MGGGRSGEPSVDQGVHAAPEDVGRLAASFEGAFPCFADFVAEQPQRPEVPWDGVVVVVAVGYRFEPFPDNGDWFVAAGHQFFAYVFHFGGQSFADGFPGDREAAVAFLGRAAMREAEKVEGLRAFAALAFVVRCCVAAELDEPSFVGVEFQSEFGEAFAQVMQECFRFESVDCLLCRSCR